MNSISARLASLVVVGLALLVAQASLDLRSTTADLRADAARQASLLARLAAGELDESLTSGEEFLDDSRTPAELCEFVQPFAGQFSGVIAAPDGTPGCTFGDLALVDALAAQQASGELDDGLSTLELGERSHLVSTVRNELVVVSYELDLESLEPTALLSERDDVAVVLLVGGRVVASWPALGIEPGTSSVDAGLPIDLTSGTTSGTDPSGTDRVFSSVPVVDGSVDVVLGLDTRTVNDALESARREALLRVLLSAVVLLVVISLLSRSIARPIRSLANRLRATSADDLPVLPAVGPAEVQDVAARFNELSAAVSASTGRLAYLAHHDSLTKLFNRERIAEEIQLAIDDAETAGPTMAIRIDLRGFGEVNDAYGSSVGDGVLAELGRRFGSLVDDGLVVGNLGGDDFVFIGAIRPDALSKTVDRILATASQPVEVQGITVECTAVAGATEIAADSHVDEVLRDLTAAVEQAKAGPDVLVVHDEQMRARTLDRSRMAADLRDALHDGAIQVAFQAILGYADGRVTSVEALARWTHAERGAIPPIDFIPVAERSGLIAELGAAVLRHSCAVGAEWQRSHPSAAPAVSVNVSAHQLARRDLPELVASALRESGLPAGSLILEVTESALIADLPTLSDRLALIRGLGVRVALDDFGTGYSSMSYLASLPVDSMKIDRSFLMAIEDDPRARSIVASVIDLAHSTGLTVVCEGVETEGQDEILRSMGADMVQGFLYHRPDQQADAVLAFILERAGGARTRLPSATAG